MSRFHEKKYSTEQILADVAKLRKCTEMVSDLVTVAERAAEEEGEIADVVVSGFFAGCDFSGLEFERVIFENCNFQNCKFKKSSFINCLFLNSDVSNGVFQNGYFAESCFLQVKGVGADFTETRLSKVKFADSNFSYANFTKSRYLTGMVERCNFSESTFSESALRDLTLSDSEWVRAVFFKTPLAGINFTTCRIDGLVFSDYAPELRHAIVNFSQAAELAKLLGVIIE